MPYWDHMGVFLKYFERLSYLLSQGVHCCDVAVMYPVAPFEAGMGGPEATDTAFDTGRRLMAAGIDFDFMDFQSLARAEVRDGRLHVSGEAYRVLVLPAMQAARWSTLQKAREFRRSGGIVIAVGALPEASDRAGRDDPELDALVKELFAASGDGVGLAVAKPEEAPAQIERLIGRDVQSTPPVMSLHRKVRRPRRVHGDGGGQGIRVPLPGQRPCRIVGPVDRSHSSGACCVADWRRDENPHASGAV